MTEENTNASFGSNFSLGADTQAETRAYNEPLYGIRGEFSLTAGTTVPYFSTLMDIKSLYHNLKTHEEISPSLENNYTLQELFQREIDVDRVQTEIVDGYLKVHNKLKFFNSITVALFPKDEADNVTTDFEDYPNNDPKIPADGASSFDGQFAQDGCNKTIFGGVQYVTVPAANLARLRWDRNRVDAVAVDGQHRLLALKLWFEGKHKTLAPDEKSTRISVLFLLLHRAAGFKRVTGENSDSIKGIAREIFTDLNKNAKEVDLATQIVLDDLSLESRCVRSLITASTCEDSEALLPLSLLRWREANNRFDQRYYLNSLVNLHLIVKDLIGLKLPEDPMSASKVKTYINSLQDCLGEDIDGNKALIADERTLLEAYENDYFDPDGDDPQSPIRPFIGIPPAFLPAAVEGFKNYFAPWLLTALTKFKPYGKLLQYSRDENLITGQFSQFQSQPESARVDLMKSLEAEHGTNWHNIVIGQHERAILQMKGAGNKVIGEQWAFKAIFQKAYLRLCKNIAFQAPEEEARLGKVDDLIGFLDNLYEQEILRVLCPLEGESFKFWTFMATTYASDGISVTAATEKRIENFLQIAYTGFRYTVYNGKQISLNTGDDALTPNRIFKEISTQTSHIEWRAHGACNDMLQLMTKWATTIDANLRQKEEDGTLTGDALEKKKREVGKSRLIALLTKCWIPQESTSSLAEEDEDDMI